MLKKSKTAVITAIATMLSAVCPVTVYADNCPQQAETIPERTHVHEEFMPYANAPAVLDGEPVQTTPANTIPDRVHTFTTVPAREILPEHFPVNKTVNLNVSVVDVNTNNFVEGVTVHLVETEDLWSNVIKRDFGTWVSDSSAKTIENVDFTLKDTSDYFVVTAVVDNIPAGYEMAYMKDTNVFDFSVEYGDNYIYNDDHEPRTDFTIYLDKTEKTYTASCEVIDGVTYESVKGADVSLVAFDENEICIFDESWITDGKKRNIDIPYSLPDTDSTVLVQFGVNNLPEGYHMSDDIFREIRLNRNSQYSGTFNLYVYPENETHICEKCGKETSVYEGNYNSIGVWTCKECYYNEKDNIDCDKCGKKITTLDIGYYSNGMWICNECFSYNEEDTIDNYVKCQICEKYVHKNDIINTVLGLKLCPKCCSKGYGGTTMTTTYQGYTTTTSAPVFTTTTTSIPDGQSKCLFCDRILEIEKLRPTLTGEYICNTCYENLPMEKCIMCGKENKKTDMYDSVFCSAECMTEYYQALLTQTTIAQSTYLPSYSTTTTAKTDIPENFVECERCGKYVHKDDIKHTSLGLNICIECSLGYGYGGTTTLPEAIDYPTTTTTTVPVTTTTVGADQKIQTFTDTITAIDENTVTFNERGTFNIANTKDYEALKQFKGQEVNIYFLDYKNDTIMTIYSVGLANEIGGNVIIKYGDVNCDGTVNIADAVMLMQSLANPAEYKLSPQAILNADVTGDGITASDALAIQMISMGTLDLADLPIVNLETVY